MHALLQCILLLNKSERGEYGEKVSAIYALLIITVVFTHIIGFGGIYFSSVVLFVSYMLVFQSLWVAWLSMSLTSG